MPGSPNRARYARCVRAAALVLIAVWSASGAGSALQAQTGSITGRVELQPQAPRRSTSRYAGATADSKEEQAVPAVVYVLGAVPGSPPPSRPIEMIQKDTAFTPAAVIVGVGSSVDFPNEDPFFHNVFAYSEARRFDLGRYPQGESKAVEFPDPGVVGVFCEVHERMRGVIVVAENPFHALVGVDGSFRIDGVPPGTYRVAFWSADHEPTEQSVTVAADETTRVEVELRR
jgi:plastocyanin